MQNMMAIRSERRDSNFRSGFAKRLRREFTEIPELSLTPAQTSQLFGVPEQECQRILSAMVRDRLLTLRADGCYCLALCLSETRNVPAETILPFRLDKTVTLRAER